MDNGRFQCGIAGLIYHPPTRTYLLLRRSASRDVGGNEWECVTGRVNQGESFESALHREIREELSVSVQLEFIVGTSHFYRGQHTPENELLGVQYACTIKDRKAIRPGEEHAEALWLTASQVYGLLPKEHWMRQAIQRAELMRNVLPTELVTVFQSNGFEIA